MDGSPPVNRTMRSLPGSDMTGSSPGNDATKSLRGRRPNAGVPRKPHLTAEMPRGVAPDDRRNAPPAKRKPQGHHGTEPAAERDYRRGRYHLGGRSRYRERHTLTGNQAGVGEPERLSPSLVR
jgi:hypothetical protein